MNNIELRVRYRTRELPNGCLVWTGHKTKQGYGKIRIGGNYKNGGRNQYVHRVMYKILVGPLSEFEEIDHLCLNTSCWNPKHLEKVSSQENRLRQYIDSSINKDISGRAW